MIPKDYITRNLLVLEDIVKCFGFFRIIIGNEIFDFLLINILEMKPSEVEKDDEYVYLIFYKGDVFIDNTYLIKEPKILFKIFVTFISLGKIPKFIDYKKIHNLFNNDKKIAGRSLGASRLAEELIFSHMARDKKNPFTFYRNTPMKDSPLYIGTKNISHGPRSSSAKLGGAYFNDGVYSSLLSDYNKDDDFTIERLLRT